MYVTLNVSETPSATQYGDQASQDHYTTRIVHSNVMEKNDILVNTYITVQTIIFQFLPLDDLVILYHYLIYRSNNHLVFQTQIQRENFLQVYFFL